MTQVSIRETVGERFLVSVPFDARFVERAKQYGGRWRAKSRTWSFANADRARVEALLAEVYGWRPEARTVIVRVRADDLRVGRVVRFAGRTIAWRSYRDRPVTLAKNVVLVGGEFARTGGSTKYPDVGSCDAVLEVRGVPEGVLDGADAYAIISPEPPDLDPQAALRAERDRLIARLAEIYLQID